MFEITNLFTYLFFFGVIVTAVGTMLLPFFRKDASCPTC